MPVGTVVLTAGDPAEDYARPARGPDSWSDVATALRAAAVPVITPAVPPADDGWPDTPPARVAHWVARTAIGIAAARPDPPLLLVARAGVVDRLPALGFAQRAARRAVAGYVLVSPVGLPGRAADWPDAPVTVVLEPTLRLDPPDVAQQARLRGWEVLAASAADALVDLARRP